MRIIIATIKPWNIRNAEKLEKCYGDAHSIMIIKSQEQMNFDTVSSFAPDIIFFPHWSYIIPEEIFNTYECVVFHMTDLPFGRGGSPLQNLIVRGFKETKISAIRVVKEIDAGPIYLKQKMSLEGSADEIYRRASGIIFEKMIPLFLHNKLEAVEQTGTPVFFKRRHPEESELSPDMSLMQLYDYIRMLDAEGYPNAYIMFGKYKISFKRAKMLNNKIKAELEIEEEQS